MTTDVDRVAANGELMRRTFDAFSSGDTATLAQLMSPDIVWHVPGRAVGNDYQGFNAFMGFIGKLMELSGGTFSAQNLEVLPGESGGVYVDRVTAQRKGRSLDMSMLLRVSIRDGKIFEGWDHPFDTGAWDDFWAVRMQDAGTE